MKTTKESERQTNHHEIPNLAREIWEREGQQLGRDLDYWLRVERQLLSGKNPPNNLPRNQLTTGTAHSQGAFKAMRLPDSVTKFVQTK